MASSAALVAAAAAAASASASLSSSFPVVSRLHNPRASPSISISHRSSRRPLPLLPYPHLLPLLAYSTSNGNGRHSLDSLASRLADAAQSLRLRLSRLADSVWLRSSQFVESQNLEEKLRRGLFAANQKFEELSYDARRSAEDFDRRYRVSERAQEMMNSAAEQAQNVDQQFGLVQKFRNASADFRRNWPMYRRQLNEFQQTPVGQTLLTVAFLWFLLSGWFFQIMLISMWLLPFAAPFLINNATKNMIIQGACPSCKRQFVGIRSQMVICNYCKAVVWQPRQDFSKDESDPSVIDVDID